MNNEASNDDSSADNLIDDLKVWDYDDDEEPLVHTKAPDPVFKKIYGQSVVISERQTSYLGVLDLTKSECEF